MCFLKSRRKNHSVPKIRHRKVYDKENQPTMTNISVYLREDYKRSTGLFPIYMSFQLNQKKIRINTEVYVAIDQWDKEKKVIRGRSKEIQDKNLVIKSAKAFITDIHVRYRLTRLPLTEEKFWREWENRAASKDLVKYIVSRCDEKYRQNDIAESTWITQKRLPKDLEEFRGIIPFYDLNESLLKDFKSYLKKRGNSANTIDKKFRILHAYITDAIKDKLIDFNPVDDVSTVTEDTGVSYLDESDLNKLIDCYRLGSLSDLQMQILRKFLFACLTGLRISDANSIETKHIVNGYIQKLMCKTQRTSGRITRIPITHSIQTLINEANPENLPGKIFDDGLTEQAINRNLKEIAKKAQIGKSISFKTGRHTFGYIYYKKTKDLLALQALMGHSKIQQTLVYSHLNDEDVIIGMNLFDTYTLATEPPQQVL